MTDLYISYSMRERHWVSQLVSGLESEGYSVWWDHVAVLGDETRPDSRKALADAKQVLVVWSPLAVEDHWVLQDAALAQDSCKLFSVCYKSVQLPSEITAFDFINLKHWRSADTRDFAYQDLIKSLKSVVRPSQPCQSQRKQALIDRKQRIQAEKARKHPPIIKTAEERANS